MIDESSDYFELGHELFEHEPNLIMVEVWNQADEQGLGRHEQCEFVAGYRAARQQNDAYHEEAS
jgi:hypothetical protein